MLRYILRQLTNLVVTLLVVTLIVFLMNELSPGDVARKIIGPYATADQVEKVTHEMGLDRPAIVRYGEYIWNALHGDLGQSIIFREPVANLISRRIGNTLLLAGVAFATIVPLSILLGTLAGMREGSRLDRAITVFSSMSASIPEFALGVFLVAVFVVVLRWLPGTSPLTTSGGWPIWSQFVLPVTVVTLYDSGYLVAMIRGSMVDVMREPYIRTAILKGTSFPRVILKHALRNALIAPFTVILLQLNYLVSGLIVVETVFAYPGFGRMMLEAALAKDVAVIEAGAMVAAFVTMSTQMLADLGYMMLDPRIRV